MQIEVTSFKEAVDLMLLGYVPSCATFSYEDIFCNGAYVTGISLTVPHSQNRSPTALYQEAKAHLKLYGFLRTYDVGIDYFCFSNENLFIDKLAITEIKEILKMPSVAC